MPERLSDHSPSDDVDLDIFSWSALATAPDSIRPSDIPHTPPPTSPATAPTAVNASEATTEIPATTGASESPESDEKDVLDRDWPRCRPRKVRKFKRIGDVPELTPEQLARSPKLMRYRELERNKLNQRASREKARIAKQRLANLKQRICRACLRTFLPIEKRKNSPYCHPRCKLAWDKVKFCFDGEAAWLHRISEARAIMSRPDRASTEALMAAEHVLRYQAPDYTPVEPKRGTLLHALVGNMTKLRAKWAPFAAEAIRSGRAETVLRPDMLELVGPMLRGEA